MNKDYTQVALYGKSELMM